MSAPRATRSMRLCPGGSLGARTSGEDGAARAQGGRGEARTGAGRRVGGFAETSLWAGRGRRAPPSSSFSAAAAAAAEAAAARVGGETAHRSRPAGQRWRDHIAGGTRFVRGKSVYWGGGRREAGNAACSKESESRRPRCVGDAGSGPASRRPAARCSGPAALALAAGGAGHLDGSGSSGSAAAASLRRRRRRRRRHHHRRPIRSGKY